MTVDERIYILNRDIQVSYWDTDGVFWSQIIPDKIKLVEDFINSTIPENHQLRIRIEPFIKSISDQHVHIESVRRSGEATAAGKDLILNIIKSNVSTQLWNFRHTVRNFDEKILRQASKV